MRRNVAERSPKKRDTEVRRHNHRTNVRPINFTKRDFVFRGVHRKSCGRKPDVRWREHYRFTACQSEYGFEVEDFLTEKRTEVHGRRLKFFRHKDLEVKEEVRHQVGYQDNELLLVKEFLDIISRDCTVEFFTRWKGFGETENDCVSLGLMQEDVPEVAVEFLENIATTGTARQKRVAASV